MVSANCWKPKLSANTLGAIEVNTYYILINNYNSQLWDSYNSENNIGGQVRIKSLIKNLKLKHLHIIAFSIKEMLSEGISL